MSELSIAVLCSHLRRQTALFICLALGAFQPGTAVARDLLLEGKCTIPETSRSFTKCTVMNDGQAITLLTGRSQSLHFKVLLSDILLAGRLTDEFEENSPLLRANIGRSLSEIGSGLDDAQNSSNVRALQFNQNASTQTLIFIASRQDVNAGEISSLIPDLSLDQQAGDDLAPRDGQNILIAFQREFERCQSLYDDLMFEEADRVLDLAIAKSRLFSQNYGSRDGAESISRVLSAQIAQLQRLREYRAYDRYLEEQQAESDFNAAQQRIADQERARRQHEYRLAVEYRKSLEAIARRWYPYWGLTYSTTIYILP